VDKSPKPRDRRDDEKAPYRRQDDDGGRGTGNTQPPNSVVSDSKGGTGDHGGDGDPGHQPGAKPSA
jgi:hypothetical protein